MPEARRLATSPARRPRPPGTRRSASAFTRAFTGRELLMKVEGHFHGFSDTLGYGGSHGPRGDWHTTRTDPAGGQAEGSSR